MCGGQGPLASAAPCWDGRPLALVAKMAAFTDFDRASACIIVVGRVRTLRSPLFERTGDERTLPFRSQMAKVQQKKCSQKFGVREGPDPPSSTCFRARSNQRKPRRVYPCMDVRSL